MAKTEQKRGRGRPAIYVGPLAGKIVKVIENEGGLLAAQTYLAKSGLQVVPGKPKKKVKVSLPTLGKLAKAAGISFRKKAA